MAYKLIMTFPGVSVEQAWECVSNWTKRKGYDARLSSTDILEEDSNSALLYGVSDKMPLPGISQRDWVIESLKLKNGSGEGKHNLVTLNRTDARKPIGAGFFDYVRLYVHIHGFNIEAEGSGVKITEIRSFDMNG